MIVFLHRKSKMDYHCVTGRQINGMEINLQCPFGRMTSTQLHIPMTSATGFTGLGHSITQHLGVSASELCIETVYL